MLDFTIINQPKSKNNILSKYIRGWLTDVSGTVIMLQIWKYGSQANQAVNIFEDLSTGDLIDVIGKVKEYNNTKYIHVELVNHVTISDEIKRRLDLLHLSTLKIEI